MMLKFLGSAVVAVSVVFAGNVGVAQTNLPTNDLTDSGQITLILPCRIGNAALSVPVSRNG